jgi:hypothetical protein
MTSLKSVVILLLAGVGMGQRGGNGVPKAMGPESTGPFGEGEPTSAPKMGGMPKGGAGGAPSMADMAKADDSGGSGPYKAHYVVVPGLSDHTLYAPKSPPPANVKMPVIVWGNGGCSNSGTGFYKFLNEIASHGYYVVANGPPSGAKGGNSKAKDLPNAIEWVSQNAGKGQFTNMDGSKIAAAGQSCGGIQAYSASLDPRVKATGIFNSGLIVDKNAVLFNNLTAPIGYFLGGPTDIAYENVSIISPHLALDLFDIMSRVSVTSRDSPPIFPPSRPISTLDMAALISRLKEESLVKPLSISLTGSSKETKLLVSSFWILPHHP